MTRTTTARTATTLAAALTLGACSTMGGGDALGFGTQLAANLSGEAQVGEGSAGGTGTFRAALDPGGELCYELSVDDVAAPTAAHIHSGPAGVNGPVVVGLDAPQAGGMSEGCTMIAPDLAGDILSSPGRFYVNVHNEAYPGGAVRGQLFSARGG